MVLTAKAFLERNPAPTADEVRVAVAVIGGPPAFLRTGQKPQTECHDNIKSLAMVFSAIESARKGRRIPVRAL